MTGALSPVILVLGFGGGPPRVGAATDAEQAEHVAATAVGLRDEELHVKDVAVRILPQPTEPHGVAATFDLVRVRGGAEVARESWSVSMRFSFLPQIPAELVVRNPMGIVATSGASPSSLGRRFGGPQARAATTPAAPAQSPCTACSPALAGRFQTAGCRPRRFCRTASALEACYSEAT